MLKRWILYTVSISIIFLPLCSIGVPQEKNNKQPQDNKQQKDDFQKKVDAAIDKGAEFLAKNGLRNQGSQQRYDILAIYALVHAGREKDKKLLDDTLSTITVEKSHATYDGAILAMALALYSDAKKYKPSLEGIADSLMKGLDDYGGWGYSLGKPDDLSKDNLSTSQFALFGLHASWRSLSADAKGRTTADNEVKQISRAVWEKIAKYWLDSQHDDGGWAYVPSHGQSRGGSPYHSMTCAGVSSLAIVRLHVGNDTKEKIDTALEKGRKWLESNFTINKCALNSCFCKNFFSYYLYSLEKACDLAGWERIGDHDWYREGAEYLIKTQESDGSWGLMREYQPSLPPNAISPSHKVQDTSFAVLFLRRASSRLLPMDTPGSWATGNPPADVETKGREKK